MKVEGTYSCLYERQIRCYYTYDEIPVYSRGICFNIHVLQRYPNQCSNKINHFLLKQQRHDSKHDEIHQEH